MTLHMLVEFLERTIFGNKLITDNRTIDNDSVFTFDIPSSSFSSSSSLSDIRMFLFDTGGDGDVGEQPEIITTITCGVLLPYFGFYYQLIVILMIQNIFNYILGSFVYKIVIEPRQERQRQQQQQQKAREKISHKNDNDDDVDNDDNDNGDRDRDDDGDTDNTISTTTMTTPSLLLSSTSLSSTSSSSSLSSLLFAFGVALPAVILEPIYAIQILKIQNLGLIMVFLATTIVNSLRIVEAVYDYIPFQQQQQKHDNKLNQQYPIRSISYWNYIIYFSCPFGIEFNNSTGQPKQILSSKSNNNNNNNHYYSYCQKRWRVVNSDYYRKRLLLVGRDFIIVSFLISVLKEYNYELFQVKKDHQQQQQQDYYCYYSSIKDLFFSWQHIGNNFLVACLLSTSLSQSSLGISLLYSLCWGYECYEMVLNPMFKSTSVSDFWGKRWNLLVHRGLKNGIYKPILLRRHHQHHDITTTCSNQILSSSSLSSSPPLSLSDKIVASGATFLVSGIIHEYVMLIMVSFGNHSNQYTQHDQHQHQHQHDQQLYRFTWKQILFFGWNGILIALEYVYCFCRSNCTTTLRLRRQGLRLRVPKIIVTAFVLYSALPVAHLFTGDYIRYGFFDAVSVAEPIINCKRIAVGG